VKLDGLRPEAVNDRFRPLDVPQFHCDEYRQFLELHGCRSSSRADRLLDRILHDYLGLNGVAQ
jgi:hypothetical protein